MIKGIAFALGACFIWGLIFIVPQFMNGFTSSDSISNYILGLICGFLALTAWSWYVVANSQEKNHTTANLRHIKIVNYLST